ncbi:MAG TPA: HIT family protein [Acidimicrobiales bacterium]|jgi:histidine triad (HIT) family protein|nr:HIT family protein [Acidimicrobiales bacterium]
MATLFTKIIEGEIPGRFVWRDDRAVVFLTIAPIRPGHALVVPIAEVDHWLDLEPDLAAHLMVVAQHVGRAQMQAFSPTRIGMIIAGLEVPHCHLHVIPIDTEADLSFAKADHGADPAALDDAAERLRAALRDQGHGERVDAALQRG